MSITNLMGTTWVINGSNWANYRNKGFHDITFHDENQDIYYGFYVELVPGGYDFTYLTRNSPPILGDRKVVISINDMMGDYSADISERTVTFVEGNNLTDSNLISFLSQNATQLIEYKTTNIQLETIADAIREKSNTSASLVYPTGFVSAINNINTGIDVSDTTATANDVLNSKYFYTAAGVKTQGNIPTQAAQTITPTTTNQTIAAGKYLTGAQTIAGDSNLVAENIAEGVSIFGVTGTHSGGGGGGAPANAVNFRDYDGTIVQSYSAEDFAALTAMPNNPSHDGLTAQGWNWTLANAKTYVAKYGRLEIGQMYITDDGKTRVYIHLEQGRTSPMLGCCPNGTVDVDWGDGTAHDTLTGTSTSTVKWTSNHSYAAPGDYIIKLTVTGSMGFYGGSSSGQSAGLLRYTSSGDNRNYVYRNAIQRVEIGSSVTSISSYAFSTCYSLANVIIPDGVTSISSYAFQNCYSLANITIPDGVTNIGYNAFYDCYSLASVTIPDSVTNINSYVFYECYSLANVIIPDGVTSIYSYAFNRCYSLASVTIPDSVTNIDSNAFSACYSLANITIPDGVTNIGYNAFYACYSLANVIIPGGVTKIDSYEFYDCYSLVSVAIPDSVTNINSYAFYCCYSVSEYHLAPTTPPTLSSTNAFTKIPADCIIYVPYSADHSILNAYKTATNWSTYASKMQEETV